MITATGAIRDRHRLIRFESGWRLVRSECKTVAIQTRIDRSMPGVCPWLTRLGGGEPSQNALARSGMPGPGAHFSAKLRNALAGFLGASSRSYDSRVKQIN